MTETNNKSIAFLCYLMCVFMALSLDLYLPSLPNVAHTFGSSMNAAQLSLNIFLFGFGFSQIFYGIISDHFGRRSSLLIGLVIYFLASLGCMLSKSIDALIIFRLIQSFGACSASVSSFALARDTHEGKNLLKILANMSIVMTVVPALAPLVGSIIDKTIGWRYSFLLLSILSVITFYFSFKLLNKNSQINKIQFKNLTHDYAKLIYDKSYIYYALISATIFVAFYFFIAASPFLLIQTMKLSPVFYGITLAINSMSLVIGNQLAKSIDNKLSQNNSILLGTAIMLFGSLLMILESSAHSLGFVFGMLICSFGIGIISPSAMAAALADQKTRSGQASAFAGFIRFSLAMLISTIFNPGFLITGLIIASCAILNLILIYIPTLSIQKNLTYDN